jgi:phosphatidylserine/phosphatidylglycerophosphate/cardiolipin synthase-like enzyme
MWCNHKIKVLSVSLFALASSAGFARSVLRYKNAQIYTDNADALTSKYNRIGEAKNHIDAAYFIIEDDYSSATLVKRILERTAEQEKNGKLKTRILVDYFMTEKQLPLLKFLSLQPGFEVRRYGAPTKEWTDLLAKLNIDGPLFISSLMAQNGKGLTEAFEKATLDLSPEILRNLDLAPEANPFVWISKVSAQLPELLARIKDAKTNVPIFVRGLATFLKRTHHKLLVIDGNCFQMGGRNWTDEYHANIDSVLIKGNEHVAGLDPALVIKERSYPFLDLDISTCLATPVKYSESPLVKSFEALWADAKADPKSRTVDLNYAYTQAEKDVIKLAADPAAIKKIGDEFLAKAERKEAKELLDHKNSTVSLAAKNKDGLRAVWVEQTMQKREIIAAYIELAKNLGQGDVAVFPNAYFFLTNEWTLTTPLLKSKGIEFDRNLAWEEDRDRKSLGDLYNAFVAAANRGAKISFYTNSWKTTDLSIVNAFAYAKYKDLLSAGKKGGSIRLFELGDVQGDEPRKASLHMKGGYARFSVANSKQNAMVFVVGSYNLDPRSCARDTNNALFLEVGSDQQLAAKKNFDDALAKYKWNEVKLAEATDAGKGIVNIKDVEGDDAHVKANADTRKKMELFKIEI